MMCSTWEVHTTKLNADKYWNAHLMQFDIQSMSAAGESESEDDDNDDSDFDEQPLSKPRKPARKKPAGQPAPKRQTPKGKKVIQTPHVPVEIPVSAEDVGMH